MHHFERIIVRLKFRQGNGLLGPAYRLLIQMAEMQAEIDQLNAKVKRLTPKNSSVPPSMQHPHARPTAKLKSKTKKPRGGQNGHKRTIREQIPVEQCTEVIPLHSKECRHCREGLKGKGAKPIRHQVLGTAEN